MSSALAWLALGSNLGDRAGALAAARARISSAPGVLLTGASPVEETMPLGALDQPAYLNQMLRIQTTLSPEELLALCQQVERQGGRLRSEKWASRTIDVDLVSYENETRNTVELMLPHPGLRDRSFWKREMAMVESND